MIYEVIPINSVLQNSALSQSLRPGALVGFAAKQSSKPPKSKY